MGRIVILREDLHANEFTEMQSTDASGTSTLLEIPAEASGDGDAIGSTGSHTKIKTAPVPSMLPVAKKPNFEWYQNDSSVIITFYIPDVPQDKCTVDISSSSVGTLLRAKSSLIRSCLSTSQFSALDPSIDTILTGCLPT